MTSVLFYNVQNSKNKEKTLNEYLCLESVWSIFTRELASIKSETMWLNAVLTHAIMLAGKQYINLSRNHLDFIQN